MVASMPSTCHHTPPSAYPNRSARKHAEAGRVDETTDHLADEEHFERRRRSRERSAIHGCVLGTLKRRKRRLKKGLFEA